MTFAGHLLRLLRDAVQYSLASRRYAVIALVVLGLVLVMVTSAAQASAPFLLYPFA